jgi:hypothetical protein
MYAGFELSTEALVTGSCMGWFSSRLEVSLSHGAVDMLLSTDLEWGWVLSDVWGKLLFDGECIDLGAVMHLVVDF